MTYEKLLTAIPSKVFHSCILTTYSFDFHFMEEKVRRQLQSKGIINIAVLQDDNMLQHSLGNLTGNLAHLGKSYSLSPVFSSDLFHPKIYLFAGKESALILIGSGNLTSTGHGKNHEIWKAIYIENIDDPKLPFFYEVFDYLESFFGHTADIVQQQKEWLKQNSNFFPQKISTQNNWYGESDFQFKFIANTKKSNHYQQLIQYLPTTDIKQINVVAPYFDKKGKMLSQLNADFSQAKIQVLLQPKTCLPPIEMASTSAISFFKWSENLLEGFERKSPNKRQHAKIFQFLSDEEEYLLLGSANASIAAFGGRNFPAKNEEAGILMKRKKGDWLKEFGLEFKGDSLNLSDFNFEQLAIEDLGNNKQERWKYKIIGVEKSGQKFHLTLNQADCFKFNIRFFDGWGNLLLKEKKYVITGNKIEVNVGHFLDKKRCQFLQLFEENKEISNKGLVLSVPAIHKNNPSEENRRLQQFLGQIEMNGHHTLDLIDYFNTLHKDKQKRDKEEEKRIVLQRSSVEESLEEEEAPPMDFVSMTYEEYSEIYEHEIDDILLDQMKDFNAIKILETIFKSLKKQEDFKNNQAISEEESDDIDKSSGRSEEHFSNSPIQTTSIGTADKLKEKLVDFFIQYWEVLSSKIQNKLASYPSLIDLAMYLICLYILLDAYEKPLVIKKQKSANEKLLEKRNEKQENEWDNFRIIAYDLMGLFTLFFNQKGGFVTFKDQYTTEKMQDYRQKSLIYSLVCLYLLKVNQFSKAEYHQYILPLFGNIRTTFLEKNGSIHDQLKACINVAEQFDLSDFNENDFSDFILKLERDFHHRLDKSAPFISKGYYFNPSLGWTFIDHLHTANPNLLYLIRAGFYFENEQREYILFKTGCYFRIPEFDFLKPISKPASKILSNVFRADFGSAPN